jgi:hypothetical protein
MEYLLLLRDSQGRVVTLWQKKTRRVARQDAEEHEVEAGDENDGKNRIEDSLCEVAPLIHVLHSHEYDRG